MYTYTNSTKRGVCSTRNVIFSGDLNMWNISVCVWVCVCMCASAGSTWGAKLRCDPEFCVFGKPSNNEHEFVHKGTGQRFLITFMDGGHFHVNCKGWRVLEIEELPRFESELVVPSVTLKTCPPPATGSFKQALAAFNVTLLQTGSQGDLSLESLPLEPPLAAHHFDGLEGLINLTVTGLNLSVPTALFLDPLHNLRSLNLRNVQLPPGELDHPTVSLRRLVLKNTGLEQFPDDVFKLPDLRILDLYENKLALSRLPQSLTMLNLKSKSTNLSLDTIPTLEILTLLKWTEKTPGVLKMCGRLQKLQLNYPELEVLPGLWVSNCLKLQHLSLTHARYLKSLPENLLHGAEALTHVTLMNGALEELPMKLFYGLDNLISLDLKHNNLLKIPSGLFAGSRALQILYLSHNNLDSGVWVALEALYELSELILEHNTHLGNACDGYKDYSKINRLEKLKLLNLNYTNITHICYDWRQNLIYLKELYLENTHISILRYEDLQYRRDVTDAVVYLQGAPVTSVEFSLDDYNESKTTLATDATVYLHSTKLQCDCRMYWTWLALQRSNSAKPGVYGLRCATKRYLRSMSVDEMVCPAADVCNATGLPSACSCTARPEFSAEGSRMLVRAHCEDASLTHVPKLRAADEWIWKDNDDTISTIRKLLNKYHLQHDDVMYDLLLANNSISVLHGADLQPLAAPHLPHLQHHYRELDLTNNTLSRVDKNATILMKHQKQLRVHLADNPLICDCSIAPLLRELSKRNQAAATCADGRPLDVVPTDDCPQVPLAAWITGALLALIAVAATLVACFANRERRFTLVVILYKIGLLQRRVERDDCRFDAFISFSHKDEKFLREIVDRLESGPNPYRLCLHYRDWVPGLFIPDQIVESVRQSRRTVALVSRHFLDSDWTRAEFREAYGHAMTELKPRLVVVLLDDPATLTLDARLRRYLRSNTYVRWGDPWFWGKLELALPIPQSLISKPPSPAALALPVAPIALENPASLVSTGPPLKYPLPDDRQPETICLETLSPALNGNGSPKLTSAPHPSRSPTVAVAS